MKKMLIFLLLAILPICANAQDLQSAIDAAQANYTEARLNNDLNAMRKSVEEFEALNQQYPNEFEVMWRLSRTGGKYAQMAKEQQIEGWKDICHKYGKQGIVLGGKAREINPNRAEGYFYEAWNVGLYSDSVSIITAIKEGLKHTAQNGFEKAYEIDKSWNNGAPLMALGHFWQVLSWPLKDNKAALKYFEEYEKLGFLETSPEREMAKLYYSELLLELKGDEHKAKAKQMLTDLTKSESALFRTKANEYLKTL